MEKTDFYTIISIDEAEGADTSEGFIKPLVAHRTSSLAVIEVVPHSEAPSHVHEGLPYFEIILFIIEGELEVTIRDHRHTVKKGMAIMSSPDEIGWANKTDTTVKMLIFHGPPPRWKSAEEFFERMKSLESEQ